MSTPENSTTLGATTVDASVLAAGCLGVYLLVTDVLCHIYFISTNEAILGAMWAVISTIFVNRTSYRESAAAGVSRVAATLISFAICFVYLLFLPFHPWALALLIGASVVIASAIRRPQDALTAAITTTVIMVVAEVSPQDAWVQPILRFGDTVVGVAVGLLTVWIDHHLVRPLFDHSDPDQAT
jgi:uncharacterized membrane protein YgaE (UPF0421/DUF939 family)